MGYNFSKIKIVGGGNRGVKICMGIRTIVDERTLCLFFLLNNTKYKQYQIKYEMKVFYLHCIFNINGSII